jgi:ABC-type dipeptide/oligopeptide/nickel transport system ATPase component
VTDPLLRIENLHVRCGDRHAVRGVSLDMHDGEAVCLVGQSGCGKTLTGLAIMRLLPSSARSSAATVRFDGTDLATLSNHAMANIRGARIGMVFRNPMAAINPAFTIGSQLMETWHRHRGGTAADARAAALAMLARAGIADPPERMRQYAQQLSADLCQRVMIALALICEPALLIADEPTAALDVTTQAEILHLLARLQREMGMALLLMTHDLRIASHIADRVAVMHAGEIVEVVPRRALFHQPMHHDTRALLDAHHLVRGVRPLDVAEPVPA